MTGLNVSKNSQLRSGQLYFVQWLRVFLISLVVAHHAAQPYGPTGGDWPISDPASSNWLGPFFLINSAFFMGFFFFLSGYFTSGSYDRKGGAAFVCDRVIRLGVPLAVVSLFVFGLLAFSSSGSQDGFFDYLLYQYIGQWQIEMGPLWFLAQLLALSLVYALWRRTMCAQNEPEARGFSAPNHRTLLIYALVLGVVGMIVRTFYQQDVWVKILGVIPGEVVHMPQYWSLFVIGIIAGRGRWLEKIPYSLGTTWFVIGLIAFVIALVTHPKTNLIQSSMLPDGMSPELFWSYLWGLLEAFICVGFIIGFSVFSRECLSAPNKWLERLDQNVFGVYIIHVFIVVGLQGAILNIDLPALVKFLVVTIVALIISFVNAGLLRVIPGVKRVI